MPKNEKGPLPVSRRNAMCPGLLELVRAFVMLAAGVAAKLLPLLFFPLCRPSFSLLFIYFLVHPYHFVTCFCNSLSLLNGPEESCLAELYGVRTPVPAPSPLTSNLTATEWWWEKKVRGSYHFFIAEYVEIFPLVRIRVVGLGGVKSLCSVGTSSLSFNTSPRKTFYRLLSAQGCKDIHGFLPTSAAFFSLPPTFFFFFFLYEFSFP